MDDKELFDRLKEAKERLSRHRGFLIDERARINQQIELLENELKMLRLGLESKEKEIETKENRLLQLYDFLEKLPDKIANADAEFSRNYEDLLISELRNLAKFQEEQKQKLASFDKPKTFPWSKNDNHRSDETS